MGVDLHVMICGVEKASLNGFCQGIYTRVSKILKVIDGLCLTCCGYFLNVTAAIEVIGVYM